VILGLDTATAATAVAAWGDGVEIERRDDPAPGARPAHATRLLELLEEVLAAAGGWDAVERIAVGVGPGGFTGLRHGIATARALAQARGLPLTGVSSLEALARAAEPERAEGAGGGGPPGRAEESGGGGPEGRAEGSGGGGPEGRAEATGRGGPPGRAVVAVIDARRGEVFAAAYAGGELRLGPLAIAPAALAGRLAGPLANPLAVGDGSVRFREEFERAGAVVPADSSPLHRVSALQICRLGAEGAIADRDALIPDYRREPDASPPQRR
jgi:tRNA threonylcarbamoyladenosine biosynthesis protein TsaB